VEVPVLRTIPLLLLAAACAPEDRPEPPACDGTQREVALDEPVGAAGVTAEDVLAFVAGRFVEEAWDGGADPEELTVEVAQDGRVLACEGAVTMSTPTASTATPMPIALDWLDVELEIRLSTADGRYDGTAYAFASSNGDGASAHFDVALPDPVNVEITWSQGGFAGEARSDPDGATLLGWPYAAAPW
jgi:hypothetical protein